MNNYSLDSASRRWWWPSAAAGAAASAVIGALLVAPQSTAMPARTPTGEGAAASIDRPTCPAPPDVDHVGVPWAPSAPTGCDTLDRWWRYVDGSACPPPPDIRYVGGPWVPAVPTGCDTLDHWWRYVAGAS
jgi:hypothetical protein